MSRAISRERARSSASDPEPVWVPGQPAGGRRSRRCCCSSLSARCSGGAGSTTPVRADPRRRRALRPRAPPATSSRERTTRHIRPFAIVPLSLLPALVPARASRLRRGATSGLRHGVAAGVVLVTLAAVLDFGDFTRRSTRVSFVTSGTRIAASWTTTAVRGASGARARAGAREPRRVAVRRAAGPPPHELRSDVHVLPAPRASAGLVLHGDESRAPRTGKARGSRTSCAAPTG